MRYWSPWLAVFAVGWLGVLLIGFGDPGQLVSQHWPLVGVGLAGALLGNATAVGGGLVFIPVLTLGYGLSPVIALKLALASQVFGMTSGAVAWAQRRMIPKEGLLPTLPGLVIGSLVSVYLIHPDAGLVKTVFGPISITIGILILVFLRHHGTTEHIPREAGLVLFASAIVGALITGWAAIGQGEIIAAILILAYGLRTEQSIGLGVLLLALNSLLLVALHHFSFGDVPWQMAMFTGLGCVFGARLGPYLTQWADGRKVKIAFAAIAIGDGLMFMIAGLL